MEYICWTIAALYLSPFDVSKSIKRSLHSSYTPTSHPSPRAWNFLSHCFASIRKDRLKYRLCSNFRGMVPRTCRNLQQERKIEHSNPQGTTDPNRKTWEKHTWKSSMASIFYKGEENINSYLKISVEISSWVINGFKGLLTSYYIELLR